MIDLREDFLAKCRDINQVFSFFEGRTLFPTLEPGQPVYPEAQCYCCSQRVRFSLGETRQASEVNWRESVVCPVCGLINRWRSAVHLFELLSTAAQQEHVYMTEQITLLYQQFKLRYPDVIGSEYVPEHPSGTVLNTHAEEVLIQDVTRLSFDDGHFSSVLSMDVLEHVPDYVAALNEFSRVTRAGGLLLLSVPFSFSADTVVHAEIDTNGQLIHHTEPEYHDDPLSEHGVLCFQSFGMDLLGAMRAAGYRDSCLIAFNSIKWGYPDRNMMFVGVK